jgi:hypothetical protein
MLMNRLVDNKSLQRSEACAHFEFNRGVDVMKRQSRPQPLFFITLAMLTRTLIFVVPLLLASPARALAYADPGTGAFVYQAAYAVFLGGTFYLRKLLDRVWRRRK